MKALTDIEMFETVKAMTNAEPDCVRMYLDSAQASVVAHIFPFDEAAEWEDVPARYHLKTCEIAAYLINKRGAEGEKQHIESDVSRTYASSYIPDDMFAGMIPFCGVPR